MTKSQVLRCGLAALAAIILCALTFSSAAAQVAEAVNANPNVSCDVGQIMFGQTITMSGDSMKGCS